MEELVPIFEKEGIALNIEPHPEDWVETLHPALDMIRVAGSKNVKFLYCAPHTFYFGADMGAMIREAGATLAHVHVADTYNHKASSGLRYICNPPGAQGDGPSAHGHRRRRDRLGRVLLLAGGNRFRRRMTACVFAWEERADESGRYMRETMRKYVDKYWKTAG